MTRRFLRVAAAAMVLGMALTGLAGAQTAPDLDQGWGTGERGVWYGLSQGSRLVPLAWLKALERPDEPGRFLDYDYIARFRYIPARPDAPGDRLPLGFVTDTTPDRKLTKTALHWTAGQGDGAPWVGMNCSACHTGQITYTPPAGQPVSMIVDGGSTMADFQSFIDALHRALALTLNPPVTDPGRFDRFAAAVLGAPNSPDRPLLKAALGKLLARQDAEFRSNALPAGYHYGFGRLDAFGNIYNKTAIAAATGAAGPMAPNAPVSYPFLWNVPQHDKVQWNGIAPNKPAPLLPMLRNAGEVIGVFADIRLSRPQFPIPLPGRYVSSVNVGNLQQLEVALRTLKPPRWPDDLFGRPDPADVRRGEGLYRDHCADCHHLLPGGRDDLETQFKAEMFQFASRDPARPPPGTDIWMACNAVTRTADSGLLKGTLYGLSPKGLEQEANVSDMLVVSVAGALLAQDIGVSQVVVGDVFGVHQAFESQFKPAAPKKFSLFGLFGGSTAAPQPTASDEARRAEYCRTTANDLLGYKARPLYGVWATAPYLHNGSVPNLDALLSPPAQRPKHFKVDATLWDPVTVGYPTPDPNDPTALAAAAADPTAFHVEDSLRNPIAGNSNAGHDYGNAGLSADDRRAIIAYLKAGLRVP